jgi:hypothetical protein
MSAQYPGIRSGMNPQAQVAMPGEVPREPGLVLLWWTQCRGWVQAHRLDLAVVAGLLLAVGLVHGIGYDRFPGRINDDEGTYATQAYAVQYWHTMAHYTYWYDHPPLGWITIAAYTWATHAFERLPTAVTAGRETMLWAAVTSAALMYLLARRLGFHRVAAAAAVLIFGLSPLVGLCQVGARACPRGRSQRGAGRLQTGQAPAQHPSSTCNSSSSCHTLRPTPPVSGGAAAPGSGTRGRPTPSSRGGASPSRSGLRSGPAPAHP